MSGTLIPLDSPVVVHDISRTGFSAISRIDFRRGDILDFRFEGGSERFTIAARVVHTRLLPNAAELLITGFEFVPGELLGLPPLSQIDRLIETVTVREGLLSATA